MSFQNAFFAGFGVGAIFGFAVGTLLADWLRPKTPAQPPLEDRFGDRLRNASGKSTRTMWDEEERLDQGR